MERMHTINFVDEIIIVDGIHRTLFLFLNSKYLQKKFLKIIG